MGSRQRYFFIRTLQIVPQLIILTILAFAVMRLAPGDPIVVQFSSLEVLSGEQVEALRAYYGLDQPLFVQYLQWLGHLVCLDLGNSFIGGQPVIQVIGERIGPTLLLTSTALIISLVGGVLAGVVSSQYVNSWLDHLLAVLAFFGYSIPGFWAALMAIALFAMTLHWLPVQGMVTAGQDTTLLDVARHLVLPALVLGLEGTASITRYVRSSMLEVLGEDYIRTAQAKGLSQYLILRRHALRNALLPVITILGLRLPGLLTGSVLVETVFAWPGMGREAVLAATSRNYTVTMGLVVIVGTMTIFGNLLADLAYQWADPRIRQT